MNIRLEHPGLDFVDPLSFSHPLRNYRRVANRKKLSQQAITCAAGLIHLHLNSCL